MLYATDQEFDFVGHEKYRQIALNGSGSVETRWRRKDGAMIDILLSSAPLVAGDLSRGVTFTALDITERRRGEDALRASEKRYRQLIEMLQEGIWTIDADARTTFVNPRMAEMLGYTVEEMLGKHLFSFMDDRGVEECKRLSRSPLQAASRSGTISSFSARTESGYTSRIETAPMADEDGVIVGAIAGVQDQTERKRAEGERRLFETRITGIAEAREPRHARGGRRARFQQHSPRDSGESRIRRRGAFRRTRRRARVSPRWNAPRGARRICASSFSPIRGRDVSRSVLSISRSAVEETAQMLAVSISKKAELRFDFAPDMPLIEADETQIRQVIMNLIINASEALGEESGVIAVSAGAMECDRAWLNGMIQGERLTEGRYVFLEVSDTGCGMDEETQTKIFDPFFTTKSAGRGLGLPVILGIVRGHGGAIGIRSEQGHGHRFSARLPRVDEHGRACRRMPRAGRAAGGGAERCFSSTTRRWCAPSRNACSSISVSACSSRRTEPRRSRSFARIAERSRA